MACCATTGCEDPACMVCSVPRRFADVPQYQRALDRREDAPALNGTKSRASRDPRFVPRRRKELARS